MDSAATPREPETPHQALNTEMNRLRDERYGDDGAIFAVDEREPETPQTYCPCGGRCHHDTHPCSLGCWAAQKPWRVEEAVHAEREAAAAPGAALDDLAGYKVFFTAEDIRAAKIALGNPGDKAEGLMFICADVVAAILDRRSAGATPDPQAEPEK